MRFLCEPGRMDSQSVGIGCIRPFTSMPSSLKHELPLAVHASCGFVGIIRKYHIATPIPHNHPCGQKWGRQITYRESG